MLSVMLIGFKELACIHHSIVGQKDKAVDLNDRMTTAHLKEVQQSRKVHSGHFFTKNETIPVKQFQL